jgi:PBSX family phage terminase large subunit
MQEPEDKHPSYLICPSCGAIELTYVPQPHQEEFHATPYVVAEDGSIKPQLIGIFGGYGSSKSRASLQEVFLRALENPNGTGLLSAQTLQQLKRTTIKTLLGEVIPPPLIESYNKSDGEIRLINGFTFYTIPVDDEEKIRSINMGICHLEEASGIKESIYTQLLTRMRDPFVKNKAIFVCSNPSLGWIKDIFVDNEKRKDPRHPEHDEYNPFITTYIWKTKLNKYLPPDFYEITSKGRPQWWIDRFLNGSFEHSDGQVYPTFSRCIVDPYPVEEGKTDRFGIPLSWERIIGMDHGLRNPTAVVFGAIDPEKGKIVIYNEYYKPNTLVPDHAKNLKPLLEEIPIGRLRFMVADPSIRNKTDPVNGKSVQGLYQEYGIFFTEGNNSIETGILKVNSYVERGKLEVYSTCANTVREHLNYKFPEITIDDDKNPDEKPMKVNEHSCDATRYMMMKLPDDPELLKAGAYETPKYQRSLARKEENEWHWSDDMEERHKEGDWMSYV